MFWRQAVHDFHHHHYDQLTTIITTIKALKPPGRQPCASSSSGSWRQRSSCRWAAAGEGGAEQATSWIVAFLNWKSKYSLCLKQHTRCLGSFVIGFQCLDIIQRYLSNNLATEARADVSIVTCGRPTKLDLEDTSPPEQSITAAFFFRRTRLSSSAPSVFCCILYIVGEI